MLDNIQEERVRLEYLERTHTVSLAQQESATYELTLHSEYGLQFYRLCSLLESTRNKKSQATSISPPVNRM